MHDRESVVLHCGLPARLTVPQAVFPTLDDAGDSVFEVAGIAEATYASPAVQASPKRQRRL